MYVIRKTQWTWLNIKSTYFNIKIDISIDNNSHRVENWYRPWADYYKNKILKIICVKIDSESMSVNILCYHLTYLC